MDSVSDYLSVRIGLGDGRLRTQVLANLQVKHRIVTNYDVKDVQECVGFVRFCAGVVLLWHFWGFEPQRTRKAQRKFVKALCSLW